MRRLLVLPLALAAVLAPAPVGAEIAGLGGAEGAVSLQADKLDIDILAGEATLTGKVVLSKGDLVVSCPRIDLRFDQTPHLTWARGSGGVTADVRGVHAEAPSVEVDLVKQVLDLRGGVKLTRGTSWLTADSARIDIPTAKVSLVQVKGSIPAKGP
ncbi:MAG TPA: LptA/OstA family protein [Polyangiaceae bacterium]|jgi:lipopolysaccharide export system protein LptA